MNTTRETVVVGTAMEDRWKSLRTTSGHRPEESGPSRSDLVFYRDMRFWLIVVMLVAFFVFTLLRFP